VYYYLFQLLEKKEIIEKEDEGEPSSRETGN
jgi:hypothetical protein